MGGIREGRGKLLEEVTEVSGLVLLSGFGFATRPVVVLYSTLLYSTLLYSTLLHSTLL